MINQKIWQLARPFYNKSIRQTSIHIGIGAGMGLISTGVGLFPAGIGICAAIAAAGSLQTAWREFKRKDKTTGMKEVIADREAMIPPDTKDSALTKASSYNNFYDTLRNYTRNEGADVNTFNLTQQLDRYIDTALRVATMRNENTTILTKIKRDTDTLMQEPIEEVSEKTFEDAMKEPVSSDAYKINRSLFLLADAFCTNEVLKNNRLLRSEFNDDKINDDRTMHLQHLYSLVKDKIEQGIFIGTESAHAMKPTLDSIARSVSRIDNTWGSTNLTVVHESNEISNNILFEAFESTGSFSRKSGHKSTADFLSGMVALSTMVDKHEQNNVILPSALMGVHDEGYHALNGSGFNVGYENKYDPIIHSTGSTAIAVTLQAISSKFASNPSADQERIACIQKNINIINTALALGDGGSLKQGLESSNLYHGERLMLTEAQERLNALTANKIPVVEASLYTTLQPF